jgi:hypothetical protein
VLVQRERRNGSLHTTVHIVEIKYARDAWPEEQEERANKQYGDLIEQLGRVPGQEVELHTIVLGVAGTIYNSTPKLLSEKFKVPTRVLTDTLKALHIHAIDSLYLAIRHRRFLETKAAKLARRGHACADPDANGGVATDGDSDAVAAADDGGATANFDGGATATQQNANKRGRADRGPAQTQHAHKKQHNSNAADVGGAAAQTASKKRSRAAVGTAPLQNPPKQCRCDAANDGAAPATHNTAQETGGVGPGAAPTKHARVCLWRPALHDNVCVHDVYM